MPSITLKEMRARARMTLGLRTNEGKALMPDDLMNRLANLAQEDTRLDLQDVVENHWSTTVANQQSYTTPTDLLLLKEVWVERDTSNNFQGYRLKPMPYKDLVHISRRFDTDPDTGRPEYYTISSDNILYFDPTPGSAMRFDLFYVPISSSMTTDSDTPDFKSIFHEAVYLKFLEKVAFELPNVDPTPYVQRYELARRKYKPIANARESRSTQLHYHGYFIREN